MVRLHGLVEVVGPLVFEGENVEEHGLAAVDDSFCIKCGLGFLFIEDKSAVSQGDGGGLRHDGFGEERRSYLAGLITSVSEGQRPED